MADLIVVLLDIQWLITKEKVQDKNKHLYLDCCADYIKRRKTKAFAH